MSFLLCKSGNTFWGHITLLWCWFFLYNSIPQTVLFLTLIQQWAWYWSVQSSCSDFFLCYAISPSDKYIHQNLHAPTTKHLLACISSPSVKWVFGAWGFLLNFRHVRFACGIWKVSIDHRFFTAPQGAWTLKRRRWRRKRRRNQPWLPERGRKNRSKKGANGKRRTLKWRLGTAVSGKGQIASYCPSRLHYIKRIHAVLGDRMLMITLS